MSSNELNKYSKSVDLAILNEEMSNEATEAWNEKQDKSPYKETNLDRLSLIKDKYRGRCGEIGDAKIWRYTCLPVRDVATNNHFPGVDNIVNNYTTDSKVALQIHNGNSYNIRHIKPNGAELVSAGGIRPGYIVKVLFEPDPSKVDMTPSGKDEFCIGLSNSKDNRWLEYGGNVYDFVHRSADVFGAAQLKRDLAEGRYAATDWDKLYIGYLIDAAKKFPTPDQEPDGLFGILQNLNGTHTGNVGERALLRLLKRKGYDARKATTEQQTTHGDIVVYLPNGRVVWLEVKTSADTKNITGQHIKRTAEFDYLVVIHISKGMRRFYIVPKSITLNTDLTGITVDGNNKDEETKLSVSIKSADEKIKHPLRPYLFYNEDAMAQLDRILKGNT